MFRALALRQSETGARWYGISLRVFNSIAHERAKRTSEMSICTREEIFQKKSFRYTAKIGLWQIFHFLIFVLSQEKCHYQSHWIRNFRFFFSYFGFLPLLGKFERHCLKAIRIFRCFSNHNPKRFQQTSLYYEWWRLCCSFINLTEWRERQVTCQQLIGDIKHTWKNIVIFHVCCHGFSQGWKSLYNTVVYMIILNYLVILSRRRSTTVSFFLETYLLYCFQIPVWGSGIPRLFYSHLKRFGD